MGRLMSDGTIRKQHRFTVLPEHLIRDDRVSDRAMRLWCLLDRYAGADGQAFPSRARLCVDLGGISPSSLDRAMTDLCKAGWLHKQRRYEGGPNDYTVLVVPAEDVPTEAIRGVSSPVTTPPPVATDDVTPASRVTTPLTTGDEEKEASTKDHQRSDADGSLRSPTSEPSQSSIDEEFERWYGEYPRKVGRGQALRAYKAARKKASAEELLQGLLRALPGLLNVRERQFIPHPSTWLNG